jgi:hypothetical protein
MGRCLEGHPAFPGNVSYVRAGLEAYSFESRCVVFPGSIKFLKSFFDEVGTEARAVAISRRPIFNVRFPHLDEVLGVARINNGWSYPSIASTHADDV